MIDGCPEPDVEFDASQFATAHKQRQDGCFCYPAPLDDLLSDEIMASVLRSAGYEPDEFREMMTEMAWNLIIPFTGEGDEDVSATKVRGQS